MTASTHSIGRPGDPSAVRSLEIDDVVATYVVDGLLTMQRDAVFPAIPREYWAARPELCTASGEILMSAGGLLVDRDGTSILIDAGTGVMTRDFDWGSVDSGSMIEVLHALGRHPDEIDVVALTHLHFDHAGWAFANGAKTFPNARYVLAARELAPYLGDQHLSAPTTLRHVISQLASGSTAVDLVDDGDEIVPGVRALVTPGHTPGHTAYVISTRSGRRLIAFGDAFHSPAQLTHPEWLSSFDADAAGVRDARRRLLAELAEPDTLGFGVHFGDQAFGRLTTNDAGEVTWEPMPTSLLAPPPR